ncbi:MAG TPA: histidinol phosphate phosphatase domain-containing protein [Methanomassiliicoccales archaeon]|jgi:histidinol phosphatase-like PHP family hydrolase|nr:histidinol phosphate phosphatase domain-containing protein [Methanomassiliicoccales archaeon]HQM67127.1 histidinol phosphate phosphatase domain-containing protein [Methanomassiliicoccales archaeon]
MRAELHTHTLLSDGELLPIELARRAVVKGTKYLAFTDHVSLSNLERVVAEGRRDAELAEEWGMKVLAGVEVTHVPVRRIDEVVLKARRLGAELVVVHGETISEPVEKGTNMAAVLNPEVDILAHPGLITLEEAQLARDNGVALEITSRSSHCKANGHVARMAQQAGAPMVVNTDAHGPDDLIDLPTALQLALAAGLTREEADRALIEVPKAIIKRRWRG